MNCLEHYTCLLSMPTLALPFWALLLLNKQLLMRV